MKKLTTKQFIERSIEIHGEKYDYSKVKYNHSLEKVVISCKKHGDFDMKPSNHINNKQGCPICGNESTGNLQKKSLNEFLIEVSKKLGHENYDFSLSKEFKNIRDNIIVICKKHGCYERSPRDIIRSKYFGCKKCKVAADTFTNYEFIKKSKASHNNYYLYSKTNYLNAHKEIIVTCPKHGDFSVIPHIHIKGGGFCPKCTNFVSSYEIDLEKFILENVPNIDLKTSCRNFKSIKEIDLLCESKKIAIEFDGLYWHSDLYKDKNYHENKTKKMNELGYRLIHIFEDEWLDKKNICQSMILNIFGANKRRIFARKCKIKELNSKETNKFLIENHIQVKCISKYRYGLFDQNEQLVSVMTFGKNRICLGSKSKNLEFELLRFCVAKNTTVTGAASKLFKNFLLKHNPNKITSYCDKRWNTGNLYEKLGFKFIRETEPNYFYVKGNKRHNRFKFRKNILIQKGFDKNKTEREIMKDLGYNRIYDCGCLKFIGQKDY